MSGFEGILRTIGADTVTPIEAASHWSFWLATFKTPITIVEGYYLYLRSSCPLKEATATNLSTWSKMSRKQGYEIVVSQGNASLTNNLPQTLTEFSGQKIHTTYTLLWDNVVSSLTGKAVEEVPYFIDPDLILEEGETDKTATTYLYDWLVGREKGVKNRPIALLTAHAGIGKTTVSKQLCRMIQSKKKALHPILIDTDSWVDLIKTSNFSLDALWELALEKWFGKDNRIRSNKQSLNVLVREGLFVVVLDGFDELCSSVNISYRPQDIIDTINVMVSSDDPTYRPGKILLTSRETYWRSIEDQVDKTSIEKFLLCGFSSKKRKKYFEIRLKDQGERDHAFRLSKQVGSIYGKEETEEHERDRASGVPLMLDLIVHLLHDNPDEAPNPYTDADPLRKLFLAICKRENFHQNLNIPPEIQLTIFEELFRENPVSFTESDIKEYVQVIGSVNDKRVLSSFVHHYFLINLDNDKFRPRHELLKVYFIASFLARGLGELLDNDQNRFQVTKTLKEFSNETEVFGWLNKQLMLFPTEKLIKAIRHAFKIIREESNNAQHPGDFKMHDAMSALFDLTQTFLPVSDKEERTKKLSEYLGAETTEQDLIIFEDLTINGLISQYDFTSVVFDRCIFNDVEFKNCIFSKMSQIRNCQFVSTLSFNSCTAPDKILFSDDCQFSRATKYTINTIQGKELSKEDKIAFTEDSLKRIFKKFKGGYGFSSIKEQNRRKGFDRGNPYNDIAWSILKENKIIETHRISGVDDGGINISEDKEIRREISQYMDNAILGPQLKKVIDLIVLTKT